MLVALSVLLLVAAAVMVWRLSSSGPPDLTKAEVDKYVAAAIEQAKREQARTPPNGTVAYQTIAPSLVAVTTDKPGAGADSLGAGVVVNADGRVLTALHVISGGGRIQVTFADGTKANAVVESQQASTDTAVLTVDAVPQVVVPAVLGGGVQVGDEVFPVGNPLGLRGSLSAGVVSQLGRSIRTEAGATLADLIQFDAAVNPGNSGGPLLNAAGQVVGIVTALANPSKQPYFVGIGFAAPIATAGGGTAGPAR